MNFVTPKNIRDHLKKYKPQYMTLLGMRSNGKSSAVKTFCVEEYLKHKTKFVYMRRYDDDIKNWKVERYFKNVPGFDMRKLTKDEDAFISSKNGEIYICSKEIVNGKIKTVYKESIGYTVALNQDEHYKSLNFPDAKYIIFEEFVTTKCYLSDEVNKLFSLVSTILRLEDGVVFLVANTISNVNPYFRYFEFTNIDKQKVGTVDTYINGQTTCTVWLTSPLTEEDSDTVDSHKMFFGARGKMIKNGAWDSEQKRKLEHNIKEYNVLYSMVFKFFTKMFLMQLLEKDDKHVWYVTPKSTPIQKDTRVISDEMVEDDICTIGFIPLNQSETRAFALLKQGKIAYSDNLTGTEFVQCYQQLNRGI